MTHLIHISAVQDWQSIGTTIENRTEDDNLTDLIPDRFSEGRRKSVANGSENSRMRLDRFDSSARNKAMYSAVLLELSVVIK